jgi:ribosomal protein L21
VQTTFVINAAARGIGLLTGVANSAAIAEQAAGRRIEIFRHRRRRHHPVIAGLTRNPFTESRSEAANSGQPRYGQPE